MRTLKVDTMRFEFVFFRTRLRCLLNFKTLFSLYSLPLVSVMCRENMHTPPPPTEGNRNSEGRGGREKGGNFRGSQGLLKEVSFQGV